VLPLLLLPPPPLEVAALAVAAVAAAKAEDNVEPARPAPAKAGSDPKERTRAAANENDEKMDCMLLLKSAAANDEDVKGANNKASRRATEGTTPLSFSSSMPWPTAVVLRDEEVAFSISPSAIVVMRAPLTAESNRATDAAAEDDDNGTINRPPRGATRLGSSERSAAMSTALIPDCCRRPRRPWTAAYGLRPVATPITSPLTRRSALDSSSRRLRRVESPSTPNSSRRVASRVVATTTGARVANMENAVTSSATKPEKKPPPFHPLSRHAVEGLKLRSRDPRVPPSANKLRMSRKTTSSS